MPTEDSPRGGKTAWILLGLVVAGLAAWLFLPRTVSNERPAMAGHAGHAGHGSAIANVASASAPSGNVVAHVIDVALRDGKFVGGNDTIKVRQGEAVELRLTSDRSIVLHLHGYEVMAQVDTQRSSVLAFKANMPGRFPVHEHREGAGNHRAVFFIEVHP